MKSKKQGENSAYNMLPTEAGLIWGEKVRMSVHAFAYTYKRGLYKS